MQVVALLAGLLLSQSYAHKTARLKDDRVEITVYNRQSGRHIWRRTFDDAAVGWSKDRKAVAILDSAFYLTTWRHGGAVRRYKIGPRPGGLGEPPTHRDSIRWSPDKERVLLVVPGTMGDATMDYGMLLVVRLRSGAVEDVALVTSLKPCEWAGNRTVTYWRQKADKDGDWVTTGPHKRSVR